MARPEPISLRDLAFPLLSTMSSRISKPPSSKRSSTKDRKFLADFILAHGETMPRACANCQKHGRVCKVHIRSGRCGECVSRNSQGCDIKVSSSEWSRLSKERSKLLAQIKDARAASSAALEAERMAREVTSTARSKEERLEKQLALLDKRADEAVSVTEANLFETDAESSLPAGQPSVSELSLSPFTWSNGQGMNPDDFFSDVDPGPFGFDLSFLGNPAGPSGDPSCDAVT